MHLIEETAARTTTTAAAVVSGLAAPSQGSVSLSTWRVRMDAGSQGPIHVIDREQVWMPVAGALAITADGVTSVVTEGGAAIVPGGVVRQMRAADGPVEVLVCMPVGGQATVPGDDEPRRLPWAE
jgi:quercetin dioxygenase-like cupin family protein